MRPSYPFEVAGSFFIFRHIQMQWKEPSWKKLKNFCPNLIFLPFSCSIPWGHKKALAEPWQLNTHSSDTFLSGGESPSRMKVRRDPPAHPGYNGKQGGERFRTILKYPVATDMAMKRYRVNDTSLRSWRRTRQGWDSHGLVSQTSVWCIPFCMWGVEDK